MSNERYHCSQKDCDIVTTGFQHTFYNVCRTCKMEVTNDLMKKKEEEKKNPPKPNRWPGSELDLIQYNWTPEELEELRKAFDDLTFYGTGAVKVDTDGLQHVDPFNYDDDFQSVFEEFDDDLEPLPYD